MPRIVSLGNDSGDLYDSRWRISVLGRRLEVPCTGVYIVAVQPCWLPVRGTSCPHCEMYPFVFLEIRVYKLLVDTDFKEHG